MGFIQKIYNLLKTELLHMDSSFRTYKDYDGCRRDQMTRERY